MILSQRNWDGLSQSQIEYCRNAWALLTYAESSDIELITDEASKSGSKTRFNEENVAVILGANAYPGEGYSANSRLSVLACLAHELAHGTRFKDGYRRPVIMPDVLVDEAETSLNASFHPVLNKHDQEDLIEDARIDLSNG